MPCDMSFDEARGHSGLGLAFAFSFSYLSCAFAISSTSMGKKSWASKEQQDWLFEQLGEFRKAQDAKTIPSFFERIYQEFFDKWPLPPPTLQEIAEAETEEQARTTKQKAGESVSHWFHNAYVMCDINILMLANSQLDLQQEPRVHFRHWNPKCSKSQELFAIATPLASLRKDVW
jgi:hypothetical protein